MSSSSVAVSLVATVLLAASVAEAAGVTGVSSERRRGGRRRRDLVGMAPRIVGGDATPVGRYPYLASLSDLSHPTSPYTPPAHKCTGTLIAPDVVLTGAHCLRAFNVIELGRYDLDDMSLSPLPPSEDFERHWVEAKVPHPSYVDLPDEYAFDVAVVKLYGVASPFISPVALNRDPAVPADAGMSLHAAGWGVYDHTSDVPSDIPFDVELKYVPNDVCRAAEGELKSGGGALSYENYIVPSMMCAWDSGEGVCQGDSGGPLLIASEELRGAFPEEFEGTIEVALDPVSGEFESSDAAAFEGACVAFLETALSGAAPAEEGGGGGGAGAGAPKYILCEVTARNWTAPSLVLTVDVKGEFDPPSEDHSWEGFDIAQRAADALDSAGADFLQLISLLSWDQNVTFYDSVEVLTATPSSDRRRGRSRRRASDDDRDVQVGVVAFGFECGHEDFPGAYTRVSSVLDFIEENVCALSGYVPDDIDCSKYGGAAKSTSGDEQLSESEDNITVSVELSLGWFPPFIGFLIDGMDDGKVYAYFQPGSFAVAEGVAVEYVQLPRNKRYRFVHLTSKRLPPNSHVRVNRTAATGEDLPDEVLIDADTSDNEFDKRIPFILGSMPTASPTPVTARPTAGPSAAPFVTLVLSFDYYTEQTGWAIRLLRRATAKDEDSGEWTWDAVSGAGTTDVIDYRSIGHYEGSEALTPVVERIYLPHSTDGAENVEYELKIYDSGGDGMCCSFLEGWYRLYAGPAPFENGGDAGRLLLEGGQFDVSQEASAFLASDVEPPVEVPPPVTTAPTEASTTPSPVAGGDAALDSSSPSPPFFLEPTAAPSSSLSPSQATDPSAQPVLGTESPSTATGDAGSRSGAFASMVAPKIALLLVPSVLTLLV